MCIITVRSFELRQGLIILVFPFVFQTILFIDHLGIHENNRTIKALHEMSALTRKENVC